MVVQKIREAIYFAYVPQFPVNWWDSRMDQKIPKEELGKSPSD